ncbi:MAG TPA: gliding motility lipoprotein GldB, partial [Flavobacteriaceae bacterium]|nr:gliding motility lipoprotein GldB [Flavobacteriaceae bacterium]
EQKVDVSNINVNVSVERFEENFYASKPSQLPKLKKKFPYLFPEQFHDSIWINRMQNKEELTLFNKSQQVFKNFETEKEQLEQLFKYVKYYFPNFKVPQVVTLISNLDYENNVLYSGDYLFISLDMYLGENEDVYDSFPKYINQNFRKKHLVVDVAEAISTSIIEQNFKRQFVETMVEEGKKMYLIDVFLPEISNQEKIGYSTEKFNWIKTNEIEVWRYFIENKLLYSTDQNLYKRFISIAPFSKFYMDIEKESPGRVGVYIGWQIVKAYMNNNNVTLQQMLATDANEIFNKSYYKPKK